MEGTVDTVADPEAFFIGFDMDIAHAHGRGAQQDPVHELDDRRFNIAGQLVLLLLDHLKVFHGAVDKIVKILHVHDARVVKEVLFVLLHALHAVVFGIERHLLFFLLGDRRSSARPLWDKGLGTAVILLDRVDDGAFRRNDRFNVVAGHELDVVDGKDVRGVHHGYGDGGAGAVDGHDTVFLGHIGGDVLNDRRIDLELAQVHVRHTVLFAQKGHQLVFLDEPELDQDRAEPAAFGLLRGQGLF